MRNSYGAKRKRGGIIILIMIVSVILSFIAIAALFPNRDGSSKITQTVTLEEKLESTVLALLSANTFPGFDIDMLHRDGNLERDNVADNSPQQIVAVTIEHIELTSGSSLLMTVLDDDPICIALVEATAMTENEETLHLTMQFWDYCRLTPWSLRILGDGWKPLTIDRADKTSF